MHYLYIGNNYGVGGRGSVLPDNDDPYDIAKPLNDLMFPETAAQRHRFVGGPAEKTEPDDNEEFDRAAKALEDLQNPFQKDGQDGAKIAASVPYMKSEEDAKSMLVRFESLPYRVIEFAWKLLAGWTPLDPPPPDFSDPRSKSAMVRIIVALGSTAIAVLGISTMLMGMSGPAVLASGIMKTCTFVGGMVLKCAAGAWRLVTSAISALGSGLAALGTWISNKISSAASVASSGAVAAVATAADAVTDPKSRFGYLLGAVSSSPTELERSLDELIAAQDKTQKSGTKWDHWQFIKGALGSQVGQVAVGTAVAAGVGLRGRDLAVTTGLLAVVTTAKDNKIFGFDASKVLKHTTKETRSALATAIAFAYGNTTGLTVGMAAAVNSDQDISTLVTLAGAAGAGYALRYVGWQYFGLGKPPKGEYDLEDESDEEEETFDEEDPSQDHVPYPAYAPPDGQTDSAIVDVSVPAYLGEGDKALWRQLKNQDAEASKKRIQFYVASDNSIKIRLLNADMGDEEQMASDKLRDEKISDYDPVKGAMDVLRARALRARKNSRMTNYELRKNAVEQQHNAAVIRYEAKKAEFNNRQNARRAKRRAERRKEKRKVIAAKRKEVAQRLPLLMAGATAAVSANPVATLAVALTGATVTALVLSPEARKVASDAVNSASDKVAGTWDTMKYLTAQVAKFAERTFSAGPAFELVEIINNESELNLKTNDKGVMAHFSKLMEGTVHNFMMAGSFSSGNGIGIQAPVDMLFMSIFNLYRAGVTAVVFEATRNELGTIEMTDELSTNTIDNAALVDEMTNVLQMSSMIGSVYSPTSRESALDVVNVLVNMLQKQQGHLEKAQLYQKVLHKGRAKGASTWYSTEYLEPEYNRQWHMIDVYTEMWDIMVRYMRTSVTMRSEYLVKVLGRSPGLNNVSFESDKESYSMEEFADSMKADMHKLTETKTEELTYGDDELIDTTTAEPRTRTTQLSAVAVYLDVLGKRSSAVASMTDSLPTVNEEMKLAYMLMYADRLVRTIDKRIENALKYLDFRMKIYRVLQRNLGHDMDAGLDATENTDGTGGRAFLGSGESAQLIGYEPARQNKKEGMEELSDRIVSLLTQQATGSNTDSLPDQMSYEETASFLEDLSSKVFTKQGLMPDSNDAGSAVLFKNEAVKQSHNRLWAFLSGQKWDVRRRSGTEFQTGAGTNVLTIIPIDENESLISKDTWGHLKTVFKGTWRDEGTNEIKLSEDQTASGIKFDDFGSQDKQIIFTILPSYVIRPRLMILFRGLRERTNATWRKDNSNKVAFHEAIGVNDELAQVDDAQMSKPIAPDIRGKDIASSRAAMEQVHAIRERLGKDAKTPLLDFALRHGHFQTEQFAEEWTEQLMKRYRDDAMVALIRKVYPPSEAMSFFSPENSGQWSKMANELATLLAALFPVSKAIDERSAPVQIMRSLHKNKKMPRRDQQFREMTIAFYRRLQSLLGMAVVEEDDATIVGAMKDLEALISDPMMKVIVPYVKQLTGKDSGDIIGPETHTITTAVVKLVSEASSVRRVLVESLIRFSRIGGMRRQNESALRKKTVPYIAAQFESYAATFEKPAAAAERMIGVFAQFDGVAAHTRNRQHADVFKELDTYVSATITELARINDEIHLVLREIIRKPVVLDGAERRSLAKTLGTLATVVRELKFGESDVMSVTKSANLIDGAIGSLMRVMSTAVPNEEDPEGLSMIDHMNKVLGMLKGYNEARKRWAERNSVVFGKRSQTRQTALRVLDARVAVQKMKIDSFTAVVTSQITRLEAEILAHGENGRDYSQEALSELRRAIDSVGASPDEHRAMREMTTALHETAKRTMMVVTGAISMNTEEFKQELNNNAFGESSRALYDKMLELPFETVTSAEEIMYMAQMEHRKTIFVTAYAPPHLLTGIKSLLNNINENIVKQKFSNAGPVLRVQPGAGPPAIINAAALFDPANPFAFPRGRHDILFVVMDEHTDLVELAAAMGHAANGNSLAGGRLHIVPIFIVDQKVHLDGTTEENNNPDTWFTAFLSLFRVRQEIPEDEARAEARNNQVRGAQERTHLMRKFIRKHAAAILEPVTDVGNASQGIISIRLTPIVALSSGDALRPAMQEDALSMYALLYVHRYMQFYPELNHNEHLTTFDSMIEAPYRLLVRFTNMALLTMSDQVQGALARFVNPRFKQDGDDDDKNAEDQEAVDLFTVANGLDEDELGPDAFERGNARIVRAKKALDNRRKDLARSENVRVREMVRRKQILRGTNEVGVFFERLKHVVDHVHVQEDTGDVNEVIASLRKTLSGVEEYSKQTKKAYNRVVENIDATTRKYGDILGKNAVLENDADLEQRGRTQAREFVEYRVFGRELVDKYQQIYSHLDETVIIEEEAVRRDQTRRRGVENNRLIRYAVKLVVWYTRHGQLLDAYQTYDSDSRPQDDRRANAGRSRAKAEQSRREREKKRNTRINMYDY